ncbi:MAG TPA: sulfide/dihydroorotate dehydrogenase-like FAD/NAD-binding protein [Bacteroidota bacterium]|nr:sulfide/dihydroorotate dehydrogenase-like FAD/NAD-binding protein [Bacteroidota bacterium]
MYTILQKNDLAAKVFRYVISAPDVARKARAGQFVILRLYEEGERIPITLADWDPKEGTITLYVQAVGKTTTLMSAMKAGERLLDVVGPFGIPSHVEKGKTLVALGGGFGIAAIHPIVRAHKLIGNRTISIIGARTKELMLMELEMRAISDEMRIATDDGSYGTKGFVTTVLKKMLDDKEPMDVVLAIGPVVMMKAVADLTRPFGVQTLVSLNPIMMDGTGMCGACRVVVNDKMQFACVDGPEFNAHQVDFELLLARQKMYSPQEKISMEIFERICQGQEHPDTAAW